MQHLSATTDLLESAAGLQVVADLGKEVVGGRAIRSQATVSHLAIGLDDQEHNKRQGDESDDVVNELTDSNWLALADDLRRVHCFFLGSSRADLEDRLCWAKRNVSKADLVIWQEDCQKTQKQVRNERVDNSLDCCAHDEGHCHAHEIAGQQEFFEFLNHAFFCHVVIPFGLFNRLREGRLFG
jgi:hypothetical protein